MKAVTHLEKVIAGETSAVTHLEKVIARETTSVAYTEKVIAGEVPPITHLQKVIAGVAKPVTHLEYVWAGGSPPSVQEYTGAVPVTFVADGTPLIDYLISGNTVQSATPTPDNPIMPQGAGDRTSNLFDKNSNTINNNGQVRPGVKVSSGTYSINNTTDRAVYYRIGNEGTTMQINAGTKAENISANDDLYVWRDNNVRTDGVMLNSGSTPLPYEPYGYKIPISSASTTTPVYLGEVETTRRIRKLVLTGEEDYVVPNISLRVPIGIYVPAIAFVPLAVISSHFQTKSSSEGTQIDRYLYTTRLGQSGGIIWLFVPRDFFSGDLNVDNCEIEFKIWLRQQYANGTPVTVWYVLAGPETAVVNEPLMKIGDYADMLSMEQAGAQIPTANGSTTLDVETAVKPSEIYIKYRGEAVGTLSALSAEVSSPEEVTEEENPEEMEEMENGSEDISLQHKPKAIE